MVCKIHPFSRGHPYSWNPLFRRGRIQTPRNPNGGFTKADACFLEVKSRFKNRDVWLCDMELDWCQRSA